MAQEIVTSMVGKVVDTLFGVAKKEISYMSNCSEYIKDLHEKVEGLTQMRGSVVLQIAAAKEKGDRLKDGVENKEDFDGGETNANKTGASTLECRTHLDFLHTGTSSFYERKYIDDVDTQKSCFNEIIKSIEDDSKQIIGIYGTGGAGKTMLAKEVAITAKSLFAAVEFITVSQPVDAEGIKNEVEIAAKRITKGEKILVILLGHDPSLYLRDMTKESGDTSKGEEDETIETFTGKLTTLVNKAANLGHTIEDQTLVRKLLNAVPDRYLQIVASIEQYSDLKEMTLEEAVGRLKTYEERIKFKKGKQVDNHDKLMFTRHDNKGKYFRGRGRGKPRFSQGRNHENFKEERKEENSHKGYNRNNFKKSNYDTSKLRCYECKKLGHIAPKCPLRTNTNEQSNLVEEDLEPTLLMATLEVDEQEISLHENDVETNMDTLWYLDNGASNHMTGVREHFKDLDEDVSGKVRFGDGSYIEIKGKGSIVIECDDKKQRIISQVYYIPDLKSNLFSLGQFTEIGCKVVMEDDELRLYDMNHKIFMKVTRQRNRLYKTNLKMGTPVCLLANLKEDTWLWHARLGHLNFESLKTMAQRNLVHGIPTIKHTTQVCDVCLIGKHNRAPFPKKAKARSTSPLDLVYGDLCGPITPPTPSGKKYIFLLVDDYSRYMWAYFLNTKDQAFDTFKEFKKSVENELRTSLRCSNDRGEIHFK
ncbi:zinc finger, CCHC-type containing protein [Tanacetum coccineum]